MRIRGFRKNVSRRDSVIALFGLFAGFAVVAVVHFVQVHRTQMPYQAAGVDSPWIPSTVKHWDGPINEMAKKYNIDANYIAIIMTMESGGYAKAESYAGAEGLMQITKPTAKDIASKYLKKPVQTYNLQDPRTNIEFGTAYLAYLRDTFGEANQAPSWNETAELMAASYNGGGLAGQHLMQGKGLHDPQTVIYSRDAFNMWRERHAHDSPTFDRWKERGGSELIDKAESANQ